MKQEKAFRVTMMLPFVGAWAATAAAEIPDSARVVTEHVGVGSDAFDGDNVKHRVVFQHLVERPGAPWIRLRIGEHDLGTESYITIMSLRDGQIQHHAAVTLPEWNNWTAYFNGDAVEVELHVAPDDVGVFVDIDLVAFGEPDEVMHAPASDGGVASICGDSDNRVASNDSRVARLFFGGCTAWLISNGGVLTAGHCTNASGDIGGVIEFNVPMSDSNGRSNHADTADQYPIIANSVAFQDNGVGEDWAQFRVGTNTETGLRAHIAQGFFRLTDTFPEIGSTLRVTGYGRDNIPEGAGGGNADCCDANGDDVCEYNCNSTSYTLQTATGPLDDIDGYDIEHDVDMTSANSGCPIIWEATDLAIGINTHHGCDSFVAGYNNFGIHFTHPTMASWINNLRGDDAMYVDVARNIGFQTGTVFRPWETVAQGVIAVPNGGVVSIVAGSYPASAGNTFTAGTGNKAMTLEAPVGVVTIGN